MQRRRSKGEDLGPRVRGRLTIFLLVLCLISIQVLLYSFFIQKKEHQNTNVPLNGGNKRIATTGGGHEEVEIHHHKQLSQKNEVEHITITETETPTEQEKNETLLMLYWTPVSQFMGAHMLGKPPGKCPVSCWYTEDTSQLGAAAGVVFHLPGFWESFPSVHAEGQQWVAYSMESEEIYSTLKDPAFMSQFDLTMTYKLSSDVVAGYWSGNLSNFMRPPKPKGYMNATAIFVASNCGATNNRTGYVQELMKYTTVHSYGKCLHNMDFPHSGQGGGREKVEAMSKYKFTLAFESHNAVDYVTEKFFHTLYSGSVPVYMGAPNIDEFAPSSHSFINANNLNPKELADVLNYLDKNNEEYEKYLQWKREGPSLQFKKLVAMAQLDARCRLCVKVAERRGRRET